VNIQPGHPNILTNQIAKYISFPNNLVISFLTYHTYTKTIQLQSSQSLATIATRNTNNEIVSSTTLPSGSVITTAFTLPQNHGPPISANSVVLGKLSQPVSTTDTDLHAIKLKGRANSSLTRSVMMQLEQMRVVKELKSKTENDLPSEAIVIQESQAVNLKEQTDEQMSVRSDIIVECDEASLIDKQNEIVIEDDNL
jgi:hypothetical protein